MFHFISKDFMPVFLIVKVFVIGLDLAIAVGIGRVGGIVL
jgi:hypothetical protein